MNMALSAMMGALGVLSLIKYNPKIVKDLTVPFVSAYMVLFAALLFGYELLWWQPFPGLNKIFRKNFGFFYGLKGKGFYLIFTAFLSLGLLENKTNVPYLDYATGICWMAGGILHVVLSCTNPDMNAIYKPPTAGLTGGGDIQLEEAHNAV